MGMPAIAAKIAFVVTLGLGAADLCLINFVLAPQLDSPPGEPIPSASLPASPQPSAAPVASVASVSTTSQAAPLEPPPPPEPPKSAAEPAPSPPAPQQTVEPTSAPPPSSVPAPQQPSEPTSDLPPSRLVHFKSASTDLDAAEISVLLEVITTLRERPDLEVILRGHADERGEAALNHWFSETRAKSVAKYLTHAGIASERIRIEALGSRQPVNAGHSPVDWAVNRRVEIIWRAAEK